MKGSRKISVPLTLARLREVLHYDHDTGAFIWKITIANVKAGSVAGRVMSTGYRTITIDRESYYAAALAWYFVHGEWPHGAMRYRDKDRTNIRIGNLLVRPWPKDRFDLSTLDGRNAYNRAHRVRHPDWYRNSSLKKLYGISVTDYLAMHTAQSGACAICEKPETVKDRGKIKPLAVDHCHSTKVVRGLLCQACNQAIGLFGDDRNRLLSAVRYLDKHSGAAKPAVLLKEAK